jgi:dihydrofolate reductase
VKEDFMRKVIVFNRISIDGYFSETDGSTHNWFIADPEVDRAAHEMMNPDTIIFGRKTYQLFESFWHGAAEEPSSPPEIRTLADELNAMTKLVFSGTLEELKWKNSILVKNDLPAEIKKLKNGNGPDMVIFGSGTIAQQLTDEMLIDEYLLVVTPVILGSGISFFNGVKKHRLNLLEARSFKSGNVILHYKFSGSCN